MTTNDNVVKSHLPSRKSMVSTTPKHTLPTDFQKYIHLSRYARWDDDKGRRETFEETIERLMTFWRKQFTTKQISTKKLNEIKTAILALEIMPSMRTLMSAGKALSRDNVAAFNCSYVAVDNPRVFDEILYVLMCGTGVGFSVERQHIAKLPEIAEHFYPTDTTIVVADSKTGWAKALREFVSLLYQGQIPRWDVTKVRPAGARLKTFGGRASGPKPLVDLFKFITEVFKNAKGRKLNSIECHDIVCKVADIVVVGGVRRSALISLSNLTDERMRVAKSGAWYEDNGQRALANNSVAYTEKPDIGVFMKEWQALYNSKSGERGIFNREAAKMLSPQRRKDLGGDNEYGCNPCLHPDSMVETVDGRVRIADIKEPTLVYSMLADGSLGVCTATAAWKTRENAETLEIETGAGHVVRCTPDHKIYTTNRDWVLAKDLRVGDNLVHLSRSRRGARYSGVCLTTKPTREVQEMEHRLVYEGVHGVLSAGMVVHHVDNNGYNNSIDNLEAMTEAEHNSHTARHDNPQAHQKHGQRNYSVSRHNSYYGFISAGAKRTKKTIVPMPLALRSNLSNQHSTKVVSIRKGEVVDVYDLTVPNTHNFISDFTVVHNCSEIVLRSKQFCNLTECIVREGDDIRSLKRKVELATILGTMQASLTNFRYLSSVWRKNTEEEALLGVSLTGIMDAVITANPKPEELRELKEVAVNVNIQWSKRLGVNPSTSITCVKPSGTVSQLVDSASGIHARHSMQYIRTVRADKKDPLAKMMVDMGFPVEDDVMKPDTGLVFSFPIKSPQSCFTRDDSTAIEQLELWKTYQMNYTEHKPSVTISVREGEWLQVGSWCYDNFDILSGVSFLPHSDHNYQQAPYTECTIEEYNEMYKSMPKNVDWSKLSEYELDDSAINTTKELACSAAGGCEI